MSILIEGKVPLRGTVSLSGARNSAIKLIFAAMFSNEDVILENVPRLDSVLTDLEIISSIGGKAEWIGNNKLLLNGSELNNYQIPYELGSKYRTSFLIVPPLLYRFGKAQIPLFKETSFKPSPINRIQASWESIGFIVTRDEEWLYISKGTSAPTEISFKTSTHTGTENAILSSVILEHETIINNASEEPEIDDLIGFLNMLGAKVTRVEPRRIQILGTNVFKGGSYTVLPDKYEAAAFATAALLTKGNVSITGIKKLTMVPFVNFLSKIKANFEIQDKELRVWDSGQLESSNLVIAPSPGFVPDWQTLAVLILNSANGVSLVHDTVYTDRFSYIKDLNRMGADIELVTPSSQGITPIISDDSYDFEKFKEPFTIAKIKGPAKLHAERFHITDPRFANALVLASLGAEGKTEINGYTSAYEYTENFFDKLINLGARISNTTFNDGPKVNL